MKDRDCWNCFWSTGDNNVCELQEGVPVCFSNNFPLWVSKYECSYYERNTCIYKVEDTGCLGGVACPYCVKRMGYADHVVKRDEDRVKKIKEWVQRLKEMFS